MKKSIREGLYSDGILPGGLNVHKRAKHLYHQQHIDESAETRENREVCSYAFAVSEQNADGKTIVTDLNTIIDVLDLLVQNGIFDSLESEQLVNKLSQNPDLIKELTALFEANEHLAPMAGEIRQLCVRVVAQSLDMENSELTTQLTDSINAYKDQPEQLSKELTGIVQDYMDDQGISATVGTEVVDEVAEAISKEFADRDQVTEEEVIDFVLTYTQGNYTEDQIGSIVPGYGN
jgi:uncharacterized protein YPO0396